MSGGATTPQGVPHTIDGVNRLSRVAVTAQLATAAVVLLAACGSGRSYDNPPEIAGDTLVTVPATSSTSTTPPTTAYVPQTPAPTAAPPTQAPAPATYPPTNAPAPPTDPPTTLPPTTPPPTIADRYTVVGGDTLSQIANKVGVPLDALLAANQMTASSLIVPGQELAVPEGGSVPTGTPAPQPTSPPATQAPQPTSPPATPGPQPTQAPRPTQAPNPEAPPPTVTLPTAPGEVTPNETEPSCPTETGSNADGSEVSFGAGNVFDHNATTAWRCPVGGPLELTFTFDHPVHLTSVGLINGYAKLDPTLGTDRYTQNHRVQQATWTFSNGGHTTTVTQSFADGNRQLQTTEVNVTATSVTLTIDATFSPNHEDPRAELAIAEVQLIAK